MLEAGAHSITKTLAVSASAHAISHHVRPSWSPTPAVAPRLCTGGSSFSVGPLVSLLLRV